MKIAKKNRKNTLIKSRPNIILPHSYHSLFVQAFIHRSEGRYNSRHIVMDDKIEK
ncbi:hypothetical protein DOLIC_00155 [Dolichomitus sp. PSUC_FEM 10030005]|nr:hypothetical protein [Dolichomitus sp. PSUC_FEM 10030005]